MADQTTHEALFIDELRAEARSYRELADRALAQVDDAGFVLTLDAESNSIALIVKHVASNLRSRWTNFFTEDGEKPDRQRDREFELEPEDTRAALMARWEAGWSCLFATLDGMTPEDLSRTVVIRAMPHTVTRAALRSLAHTAEPRRPDRAPGQARVERSLAVAHHPARTVGAGEPDDAGAVRDEEGDLGPQPAAGTAGNPSGT